MKTEQELRAKLEEQLAIDCTKMEPAPFREKLTFSKVAICKTLLWALGENDDDRWHITSTPGPPRRVSPQGSEGALGRARR